MILILEYFYWQFVEMPRNIAKVFANLFWFGYNYFSINYCLKTLFSPWRKIIWSYRKGFDLGNRIEIFFSNVFSRFIGFLMRIFILLIWIIYEAAMLLLLIISLLFWILLPIIGILGIFVSFNLNV